MNVTNCVTNDAQGETNLGYVWDSVKETSDKKQNTKDLDNVTGNMHGLYLFIFVN